MVKTFKIDTDRLRLSFISVEQSSHFVSTIGDEIMCEFLQLFSLTRNDRGFDFLLKAVQIASPKFKSEIKQFVEKYGRLFPEFYAVDKYFRDLPENTFFIILDGIVEDSETIMSYFSYLTDLQNKTGNPSKYPRALYQSGQLFKNYNMGAFGHQRRAIGGKISKDIRVCRFCNTANGQINSFGSTVRFKNKSHAISEGLGNKLVIIHDECDACNERFSSRIEPSLIAFLQVFRSLYGIKGKGGEKTLNGINFDLDPEKGFDIKYDGVIDPSNPINEINMELYTRESYAPQDLYRCLVKFILSVIDNKYLNLFAKTLDWVNGKFDATDLPLVSIVEHHAFFTEKTMLYSFLRKTKTDLPFLVGEFHYADLVFIFIVPFCEIDRLNYTSSDDFDKFWDVFKESRTHFDWIQYDLSSTTPTKTVIKLKIDGLELGVNTLVEKKNPD